MSRSRTLWILRHAKAEEAPPKGGGDHARELRPKGRRAARAMGELLGRLDDGPELALASDAARARATAELAIEAGELTCELVLEPAIYEATAERLLAVLHRVPAQTGRLLLVGHQPGLGELLGLLLGHEPEFPAGSLARLELATAWSSLGPGCARLTLLVTPAVLVAED